MPFAAWAGNKQWEGWEYILDIVGKGDNMPIAGLIPIIAFFTYLSLDEALLGLRRQVLEPRGVLAYLAAGRMGGQEDRDGGRDPRRRQLSHILDGDHDGHPG